MKKKEILIAFELLFLVISLSLLHFDYTQYKELAKAKEPAETRAIAPDKCLPCRAPVAYKLGEFDSRFGISREEFLKVTEQAIHNLEATAQKKLFFYDPMHAKLTITLIYDERQMYGERSKTLQNKISMLIQDYHEQEKEWNSIPGHSEADYLELERRLSLEGDVIKTQVDALENLRKERYEFQNRSGRDGIAAGNCDFNELNINVYSFESLEELNKILTHEFIHALGVTNHIKNPQALMCGEPYECDENNSLTTDDIALIRKVVTKP